jgi:hypothetical protein
MMSGSRPSANRRTPSSLRSALRAGLSTNTTCEAELSVTTHDAGTHADYHNGDSTWRHSRYRPAGAVAGERVPLPTAVDRNILTLCSTWYLVAVASVLEDCPA